MRLNDDALGRALTKLAKDHPNTVYLALALSAIKVTPLLSNIVRGLNRIL
jgi:hypothetical protein